MSAHKKQWLFEIFVVLHVEPHAEEKALQSAHQSEHQGHGIDPWNGAVDGPDIEESDREREAHGEQQERKGVEEDEGMKILDHILEKEPSPEPLEQKPGNPGDDLEQVHFGFFPYVVNGPDVNVPDSKIKLVKFDEHVIGHPVALVYPVQVQLLEGYQGNSRVARL